MSSFNIADSKVIEFSPKQFEFIRNANCRWNGKIGATRCGKSHLDIHYMIPARLYERKGKQGLNVILGTTSGTIERNVLSPMRYFWGENVIGTINSKNIAKLFGEDVYCLGAEKKNTVDKIRGSEFKYVYCDEVVSYNEEVFDMLKSRLSLSYSVCDFTGNPTYPDHYIKDFIESDIDLYCQHYTIYDNPFLDRSVIKNLEDEYRGTVNFDRNILGLWKSAKGVIYSRYANNPDLYLITSDQIKEYKHLIKYVCIGIDWGHSESANTAVAVGFSVDFKHIFVLDELYTKDILDPIELFNLHAEFIEKIHSNYQAPFVFCDCAEPLLVRGLRKTAMQRGLKCEVKECIKYPIIDRINITNSLFAQNTLFINDKCKFLASSFRNATWDDNKKQDTRLDDGSVNIDSLDAFEYSLTKFFKVIEKAIHEKESDKL